MSNIRKKISRANYLLRKVTNIIPKSAILTQNRTLVQCQITYGIKILGSTTHMGRITKLQKTSIRILHRKCYLAHTQPLFKESMILQPDNLLSCINLKWISFQISSDNSTIFIIWNQMNQRYRATKLINILKKEFKTHNMKQYARHVTSWNIRYRHCFPNALIYCYFVLNGWGCIFWRVFCFSLSWMYCIKYLGYFTRKTPETRPKIDIFCLFNFLRWMLEEDHKVKHLLLKLLVIYQHWHDLAVAGRTTVSLRLGVLFAG